MDSFCVFFFYIFASSDFDMYFNLWADILAYGMRD